MSLVAGPTLFFLSILWGPSLLRLLEVKDRKWPTISKPQKEARMETVRVLSNFYFGPLALKLLSKEQKALLS